MTKQRIYKKDYEPEQFHQKRFGSLVGVGVEKKIDNKRCFLFKCDCGVDVWRATYRLRYMSQNSGCDSCRGKFVRNYNRSLRRRSDHKRWSRAKHISGRMFTLIKIAAKARDIPVSVTIDDVDILWEKQDGKCVLTGKQLTLPVQINNKINYGTASLDRKDSSIGYEITNVQWVHKDVNMTKRALSNEDFLALCLEVVKHHDKDSLCS